MNAEYNIQQAIESLTIKRLGEALNYLKPLYENKASLVGYNEYEAIVNDFQLMKDYMLRGFVDPQREQLYNTLIERLYRVAADLMISWKCKNHTSYVNAFHAADRLNTSHNFLRSVLEGYVSDVALASLEAETVRLTKLDELHARHQVFLNRLFCAILTSCQWTTEDADFYQGLLTSPTLSTIDQQVLVSAITLSAMNVYDPNKFSTLFHVYTDAQEESVKQRAFVGWVFAMTDNVLFAEAQDRLIKPLLSDENFRKELLSLQIQLLSCMSAEKDNDKIQQDIMPNLMQNSNLNISRFGITEKTEDPLESIMNPSADEEKMEIMEQNIQKMMKMQQQGSDIYFGGFKQMKRFGFFNDLSNWFTPFYIQHPALSETVRKMGDAKFLELLASQSFFCDSDKYSLALAMSQVLTQLPENMREVVSLGEGLAMNGMPPMGEQSISLRRLYLQDLYRFFRINIAHRKDLVDPFATSIESKANFLLDSAFVYRELNDIKLRLGIYFYKHKRYNELEVLLHSFASEHINYTILKGYLLFHNEQYGEALEQFRFAAAIEPDNEWLLKGMGSVAMKMEEYEDAAACYEKLMSAHAENKLYAINYSLCLLYRGRTKEALNKLYELDFRTPNDSSIQRILAWAHLCDTNAEKAIALYERIISEKSANEDYLNLGYAYWVCHNLVRANEFFTKWQTNEPAKDIELEFAKDRYMLNRNGITAVDEILMVSIIKG